MSVPVRDSIGAIKRTGEMMLSGWKLLATVCPVCTTALLSKGDQLRCPSCDLPVRVEGDERIGSHHSASTSAPPKTASSQPAVNNYADETDVPASLEELKKEYDAKNKRKNTVSVKLGEKMLSGFSLLGATCPLSECGGTPLMSLKNGPMICVSCDKEYKYSEYDELVPIVKLQDKLSAYAEAKSALIPASQPVSATVSSVPKAVKTAEQLELEQLEAEYEGFDFDSIPTLGMRAFAVDPNDTSAKISQKLMKGWALLDEVCPDETCQVPLMRNLDGDKVCVACGYEHGKKSGTSQDAKAAATTAALAAAGVAKATTASRGAVSVGKSNTVTVASKNKSSIVGGGKKRSESESETSSKDLNALYDNDTDDDSYDDLAGEIGGGEDPVGDYIKQWKNRLVTQQGPSGVKKATTATAAVVKKSAAVKPVAVVKGGSCSALSGVAAVLHKKLQSSMESLEKCESIDKSIRLTELIHKLVLAIQAIEGTGDSRSRVECDDSDVF